MLQGFRKIDADKWEFANEAFLRGQKHLLKHIRRRKATAPPPLPPQQGVEPCVEVGRFGVEAEVDGLRRDKQVLVMELVKLRQQQQTTRAYLEQMEVRLQSTEKKQQQMMNFLARAMQNPEFLHQLVRHKERRRELEEAASKKRRRPIEAADQASSSVKAEPMELGELYGFQVSELEALALEMQGFGKGKWEEAEELDMGSYDRELDDGFWEELLNEGFDEESGVNRDGEGEDVCVLADRLGFLGYSPN